MPKLGLYRFRQLKWQFVLVVPLCLAVAAALIFPAQSRASIANIDVSTYLSAVSAVMTVVALFCSLSIAWVLFSDQQAKSERARAFENLKSRLLTTQEWLMSQPSGEDRDVCMACVFEWNKFGLEDLPTTKFGDAYDAYCEALQAGLSRENPDRRRFFLLSTVHFGYMEELLSSFGESAVRQILTGMFIDTLAKGVILVILSTLTLVGALLWYTGATAPWFIVALAFVALGAAMLMVEVWLDLRGANEEETNFSGWKSEET
jgi:hypothetical protein